MNTQNNKIQNQNNSFSQNDNKNYFTYIKTEKKKILWLIFSSFLFAFASTSLLTKASTLQSGLSAVSMTISLILPITKPYLNFIYLGLNIPLIIIFWKKVKRNYLFATLTFLVSNAIFGFFIGFDFGTLVGGKEMSFDYIVSQNIFIFCPPTNIYEAEYANEHHIKNLMTVNWNEYNKWLFDNDKLGIFAFAPINNGKTLGVEKGWPIFVYTLTAVSLLGVSGATAWKCGGSTGGTDIIAYYYSTKKKKPVGTFLMIIGSLIVTFSLIVIWLLSSWGPNSIKHNINGFESFIGLQTLSSALYVVLYGKILNAIYPKYAKQVIKIDTLNLELIKDFFKNINYNHPYKIHTLTSGKTGQNIYSIETVVLLLEAEDLIKEIKKVDPSAWVSKLDVRKTYGGFDYSKVE
ncbi:MAG: YitT family protein [Mycoplasma sp.]|nr:YitT family protein [Mycoplasma sp.]